MNKLNIKAEVSKANKALKAADELSARNIYNAILEQHLDDVESLGMVGNLARRLGEKVSAINIFKQLTELQPDNAAHKVSLAQSYLDNHLIIPAEELFRTILLASDDNFDANKGLGRVLVLTGRYGEAVPVLERACALKPSDVSVQMDLVTAYTDSDQYEQAEHYATKLVRRESKHPASYYLYGRVLSGQGKFDEAIKNYEQAIKLDRVFGHAYTALARVKKFTHDDDAFIKKAKDTLKMKMTADQRVSILFCLGKFHNDCKQWDEAFDYTRQANLIRKNAVYDDVADTIYNKTHKQYDSNLFASFASKGSDSSVPVFIVGMPRSGTTLTEQIIASHPKAAGAGELLTMSLQHAKRFPFEQLDDYRTKFQKFLQTDEIDDIAKAYLDVLCKDREDADIVVDKLPDNFLYIGFIRLVFPHARIIHAVRSPLDTCLSCYMQIFRDITWANDFEWIAKRYRFYRKAMDYWYSVLPEGEIIESRYEDLVADPYTHSKRLIESIGLEWSDECLKYYDKSSEISTASQWQARQPVYKTSSKRWLNYAGHLEPLANELYEYLDKEDIDEFAKLGIQLRKKGLLKRLFG